MLLDTLGSLDRSYNSNFESGDLPTLLRTPFRLNRGEFFPEHGLSRFDPTIAFRQDASERKVFHPF